MKSLLAGTRVVINTGGKDSLGLIVIGGTHGAYWKEQDAYRVEFDNGTTQYMPAKYLRATYTQQRNWIAWEGSIPSLRSNN